LESFSLLAAAKLLWYTKPCNCDDYTNAVFQKNTAFQHKSKYWLFASKLEVLVQRDGNKT